LHGGFAALGATLVTLHPELILPLPRQREMSKFVNNPSSHSVEMKFEWTGNVKFSACSHKVGA
jgi:hypothetical protein